MKGSLNTSIPIPYSVHKCKLKYALKMGMQALFENIQWMETHHLPWFLFSLASFCHETLRIIALSLLKFISFKRHVSLFSALDSLKLKKIPALCNHFPWKFSLLLHCLVNHLHWLGWHQQWLLNSLKEKTVSKLC